MGAIQGSPIDRATLDGRIKPIEKQVAQIMRELVKIPKPSVPVTGGFLGSAQLASTAGSVVQNGIGSRVNEGLVTYASPVDPHAGTGGEGLAPSGWLTVTNGYQIELEEGWYTATVLIDLAWATPANAPDYCTVYLAGVPNEIVEAEYLPMVERSTRKGIRRSVTTGPFYAGFGQLWVEVELGSHTGTSDALVGFGGSPDASHVWTIVKHT